MTIISYYQAKLFARENRSSLVSILIPGVLLASALVLFYSALPHINLRELTDLGLVSIMPKQTWAALLILMLSFTISLSQKPPRVPLLLLHTIVLIFMLYGITTPIEEVPRFNVSWRHLGIVDSIIRNGTVNPYIDAYFNWPGFFILSALAAVNSGYKDALFLVPWASVFFNLLYLGPLFMIMRGATTNVRLIWLSLWIFYLLNWIGQDYYSPQGMNFFMLLVVLAVVLGWFKAEKQRKVLRMYWLGQGRIRDFVSRTYKAYFNEVDSVSNIKSSPWQVTGLQLAVVAIFISVTISHQLTPYSLFAGVFILLFFNRSSMRWPVVVMAAALIIWPSTAASPYFRGHIGALLQAFGKVDAVVEENLSQHLVGSPEHLLIVRFRMVITLLLWCLALIGFYLRWRKGNKDVSMLLLAGAPFPLLVAAMYGGEMLMRVYLFSLPFMVFFAASLFFPGSNRNPSFFVYAGIFLTSVVLCVGFFLVRYGNERADQFSQAEINAMQYMYDHAEPGSLLAATSTHLPFKFKGYELYKTAFLVDETLQGDVDAIANRMQRRLDKQAYLILSRSQQAYMEMFYSLSPEAWATLKQNLMKSGRFKVVYSNEDAQVFQLIKKP